MSEKRRKCDQVSEKCQGSVRFDICTNVGKVSFSSVYATKLPMWVRFHCNISDSIIRISHAILKASRSTASNSQLSNLQAMGAVSTEQ